MKFDFIYWIKPERLDNNNKYDKVNIGVVHAEFFPFRGRLCKDF